MASTKGRQSSYNRHVYVLDLRRHRARRQAIEWSKKFPLQPPLLDERSLTLGSFLISVLSDPAMRGVGRFGVLTPPESTSADILRDTGIFAKLLSGVWCVSVDSNIDGDGRSGWAFVREA